MGVELTEMLRLSGRVLGSNYKSYYPRGYYPVGRKYNAHFYNRTGAMGGDYEFNNGLPTAQSNEMYGALSKSKPDWSPSDGSKAPLTRAQVVNSKVRTDLGEKIIRMLTEMQDAEEKFKSVAQPAISKPENIRQRRRRRIRATVPSRRYLQATEEV